MRDGPALGGDPRDVASEADPPPEAGRGEEDAAEAVPRWIEAELRPLTGSTSIT